MRNQSVPLMSCWMIEGSYHNYSLSIRKRVVRRYLRLYIQRCFLNQMLGPTRYLILVQGCRPSVRMAGGSRFQVLGTQQKTAFSYDAFSDSQTFNDRVAALDFGAESDRPHHEYVWLIRYHKHYLLVVDVLNCCPRYRRRSRRGTTHRRKRHVHVHTNLQLLPRICQFNSNLPGARGCIQSGIHVGHLPTKDSPRVRFRGNAGATSDPNSPKIVLVNLSHNPNAGKIGDA